MKHKNHPRGAWRLWPVILAYIVPLAGCQSYQPVPLDLEQYRAEAASRLDEQETLRAFSQRLGTDTDQPDLFDLDDGIDAAEAEVIALFYNRDLRLARLRAGVALADAEHAGLWEDPVFGFDGAELLSPSGPFEFGLTMSLTIPVSGRLEVEEDRAEAAYHAELRRIVDAEWTVRVQVREAWAVWSVATERLKLIDEMLQATGRVQTVSDRLEEAGELTRVETRLLRAQRLAIQVQRVSAAAAVDQARLDLLDFMGVLPNTPVKLVPTLPTMTVPETNDTTGRLIRANTSLAALRADYQVAEESLRLEVRRQYPDIEIGAGLGSEDNDDRLLLGASLPLPLFNANRGGIAEARANRQLARAAIENAFESLVFQLASAKAGLAAIERQRQMIEQELIPMLDEQAAEIDRLAELGEVSTLILLETVTRRFEAKSQILDLYLAAVQGRIKVTRMLGPEQATEPAPVSEDTDTDTTKDGRDETAEGVSP
ncbi:MAG: TolC family protein [Planctomycetota bacterium]